MMKKQPYSRTGCNGKFNASIKSIDFYNFFKKKYKKHAGHIPSQGEYSAIFDEFAEEIMNKIIYEAYEFRIPYHLGNLYVTQRDVKIRFDNQGNLINKGLAPDWNATKKLWREDEEARERKQLIYHFNEHSSRKRMRFHWDRRTIFLKNKSVYKFIPIRKWSRKLKDVIKDEDHNVIYYET